MYSQYHCQPLSNNTPHIVRGHYRRGD